MDRVCHTPLRQAIYMYKTRLVQGGIALAADANQARDLTLIRHLRSGDDYARDQLVKKYLPMVKHIVRKHYSAFLEFDDLMQEGFIGLLAAINEYRPDEFDVKFSSFAYMCIIRKVYNVIKQTNGNKHKALNHAVSLHAYVNSDETRTMLDLVPMEDPTVDPAWIFETKHLNQRLNTVLQDHLSYLEYAVITLMLQGYSSREIETRIGVKAKVVDNARTRVKAKIKRIVEDYGSLQSPKIPKHVRRRRDLCMQVTVG